MASSTTIEVVHYIRPNADTRVERIDVGADYKDVSLSLLHFTLENLGGYGTTQVCCRWTHESPEKETSEIVTSNRVSVDVYRRLIKRKLDEKRDDERSASRQ